MYKIFYLFLLLTVACNAPDKKTDSQEITTDSLSVSPPVLQDSPTNTNLAPGTITADTVLQKTYSNDRFRDVTVTKQTGRKFLVTGKARVFEASISWVVTDGNKELATGHEMTDAGAPAWGSFRFSIPVAKASPNAALHLILFEESAKDGSRQSELNISL